MEIQEIDSENLSHYEKLFAICFPQFNLDKEYLDWLYFSNPLGKVVGFDAMDGDILVAHYACIPTRIDAKIGLLALNTATHPSYRSRGIYKQIALQTFDQWSSDFKFVVGVANKLAAKACVRHLGFAEIGRLNLRFGDLQRPTKGIRTWTPAEIEWRAGNPRQRMKKRAISDGFIELSVRPKNFPFNLTSIIPIQEMGFVGTEQSMPKKYGFTVDWIKDCQPRVQLPEKLKPSPLVMIYQTLSGPETELNSWSFPDFDAF